MNSEGRPLCVVMMPFGIKPDASGNLIDFDSVYSDLIVPAIRDAELEPMRADDVLTVGRLNEPAVDRLIMAEYAVADLTTANASVIYQLGIRHAARADSTVILLAEGRRLPFDVARLPMLRYLLDQSGKPAYLRRQQAQLTNLLGAVSWTSPESPVLRLLAHSDRPGGQSGQDEIFQSRLQDLAIMKDRLAKARQRGVIALDGLLAEMEPLERQDESLVLDLFLSYRAVKAWRNMIALYDKMSAELRNAVTVREQLALALNRAGNSASAEQVLTQLLADRGPSSETYGILGRIYKDDWEKAAQDSNPFANQLLQKAIEAYLKGFESDWRDAYPGINAVTLMELAEPPDPRREQILPVVRYAVERRIASGQPDYWDYATLVELAILAKDENRARAAREAALAIIREPWEAETTARNLRLINDARGRNFELSAWMVETAAAFQNLSERTSLSA